MNIWNKLTLFLKKLFRSKGRANRTEYIVGLLTFIIVVYGGDKTHDYLHKSSSLIMFFLSQVNITICIICVVNYFFIAARRLHDLNASGWWQLITFVSISGGWRQLITFEPIATLLRVNISLLIFSIFLMCKKGTPGPNKYGEPPN
jgi:uncharacterized membrane protein YhaH (DUF805 family)